ncbi:MAG TPA: CoA-transferase [Gaiellaceae bacterium]|nr:CoA-transferase [Gaiellaceae bacterium]
MPSRIETWGCAGTAPSSDRLAQESTIARGPALLTAEEAVELVPTGATLVVTGSGGGVNEPAALLSALRQRFRTSGRPERLVLYHPNGLGDGKGGGTEAFAYPGFVRAVYGSHWSWAPQLSEMAVAGEFETGIWPQGVLSQLLRESAARRPGLLTQVGMQTYLDPRVTSVRPGRQRLPELVTLGGEEWLFYPAPSVDVAFIRASAADRAGNLTMDEEGAVLDVLGAAQAAHNAGGIVIAQVRRLVEPRGLDPRLVRVPGCLVDAIVVAPDQRQSTSTGYEPGYTGADVVSVPDRPLERGERLVIARRAALELRPRMVVNLGFGIADGVASVASREGVADDVTFSVEQGTAGGVPAWGSDFGLMWNPTSILDAPSQFDFYDGGGIDLAIVSFAQVDAQGNVNVSQFGNRLVGPGGFMDITQTAKAVVFCGTFTAKGQHVHVRDGRLRIEQDGTIRKFVVSVDQITWSAREALSRGQRVLYVTERAVFALAEGGPELVEIAPGVSLDNVVASMDFIPAMREPLAAMPSGVFGDGPLGLAERFRGSEVR